MLGTSEGQEGVAVRAHQPGSDPPRPDADHAAQVAGDSADAVEPIDLAALEPNALAALAERHHLFVHDADTGLLVHDADGVTVAANPAAERMLGRPAGDLLGRA